MPNKHRFLSKTIYHLGLSLCMLIISLFGAHQVKAADPSLSLTPSNGTYYVGQEFVVDVMINSDGNNHSETGLYLDFDQTALEVLSIEPTYLYWNYFDQDLGNSTGTLIVKGSFMGNAYSSSGSFVSIRFKVLGAPGASSLVINPSSYINDALNVPFVAPTLTGADYTLSTALPDATLSIGADYAIWAINDAQTVTVQLDTQGNDVAGVDLVMRYDPALFEYQSMEWTSLLPVQQGFGVDQSTGTITISGVANQGVPVNAKGDLVRLNFLALANGVGAFTLDWSSGMTTDTNIVSYHDINTELLTAQPAPLSIEVGSGATLDFSFNLLGYLGVDLSKTGTITVAQPDVASSFTTPILSGVGNVLAHNLGTFTFGNLYDLVLKVPGYLKSKSAQTVVVGVNGPVDFGDLKPGDINNDGVINSSDLSQVYGFWNSTGYPVSDLNADGKVNSFDVGLLYAYFNEVDNI